MGDMPKITTIPHENEAFNKVASECKMIYREPFSIYYPSKCVLPDRHKNQLNRILNFEVREDDIFVLTYPKSGTTWTQEMVWLLSHNLDYEKAKQLQLFHRSPALETLSFEIATPHSPDWINYLNEQESPRCIKSHLPIDLLPHQIWTKKPKIIYVTRNPKDVLLSYFHQHRSWAAYSGSLEMFADAFLEDSLLYSPYWKHVLDFWAIKEPNVLYNTYEEMIKDLPGVIRKTAKFINKNVTDEQVATLADHLSFKKMKENASVNYKEFFEPLHTKYNVKNEFIRKGESGAWKKDMPPAIAARMDEWSKKNLENSDFPLYR